MRKFLLACAVASLMIGACKNSSKTSASEENKSAAGAVITFAKNSYDFGKIKQGDKITHNFEFRNTGTEPLIISNATATCGCTVPEYPKEPIAPGMSGAIKVVFDSAGKLGMQQKVITITSNTKSRVSEVYLTGEIQEAAPASTVSSN